MLITSIFLNFSQMFLNFSQMFSKGFYLRVVKSQDCVVKS